MRGRIHRGNHAIDNQLTDISDYGGQYACDERQYGKRERQIATRCPNEIQCAPAVAEHPVSTFQKANRFGLASGQFDYPEIVQ